MMLARMKSRVLAALLVMVAAVGTSPRLAAQADVYAPLDRILDVYVRDGLVYYAALKTERANLDRFVASLESAETWLPNASSGEQRAFWLNAYNALVLRTVINAYPIRGKAAGYPAESIAQIAGGVDKVRHRVAGQLLTLEEIEKTVIAGFGDPRMLLALGRGALGGGRLRSEPYRAAQLETQLNEAVKEFVTRLDTFRINRTTNVVEVTPLFSWREAQFVAGFSQGGEMWANRSPLERALMSMSYPHLFPSEREFLALNTFTMTFGAFDWRLNDLTGGAPPR